MEIEQTREALCQQIYKSKDNDTLNKQHHFNADQYKIED
jgi:hypothetical protein